MVLVKVKPLGEMLEYSEYFDSTLVDSKGIVYAFKNGTKTAIADTFGHDSQVTGRNVSSSSLINDISLTKEGKKLMKVPNDKSDQCYYIKFYTLPT